MKTKIAVYWPLAVVLTLAGLAALQTYSDDAKHPPLAAAEVSAELARAVSYGLVGGRAVRASSAAGGTSGIPGISGTLHAPVPQAS
ncbi:hypothetical protein LJR230_001492 [Trinickia sp. LjRoot230]|uniref:hypothetical protein n=1 Tax=Trinickia sp. LjRoot230 TaxID=3342288 RepID=UPI003ECFE15B